MKNLALILTSLLLLISCGGDDNPQNNDSDPEIEMIIPLEGITSIKLTDTAQKVFDTYGEVETSYGAVNGIYQHFLLYVNEGLSFYLEDHDSETLDLSLNIKRIEIFGSFVGETEEGIKIGSSREDVLAAFGEPDNISAFFGEDYDSLGLTISYDEEAVRSVTKIELE